MESTSRFWNDDKHSDKAARTLTSSSVPARGRATLSSRMDGFSTRNTPVSKGRCLKEIAARRLAARKFGRMGALLTIEDSRHQKSSCQAFDRKGVSTVPTNGSRTISCTRKAYSWNLPQLDFGQNAGLFRISCELGMLYAS